MRQPQRGPRARQAGVELDRARQEADRLGGALLREQVLLLEPEQVEVVRLKARRRLAPGDLAPRAHEPAAPGAQRVGDALRDRVLDREELSLSPVVALRPELRACAGVGELRGDPHPAATGLDAALERVAGAELAADGPDVGGPGLVGEHGMAPAIALSSGHRARSAMTSAVSPSASRSQRPSPARLSKGSTATRGGPRRSGRRASPASQSWGCSSSRARWSATKPARVTLLWTPSFR